MRQSKVTETQIVSILKEADAGRPVNECNDLSSSGPRMCAWCVFRPNPATDSDASRPPIPTERGH